MYFMSFFFVSYYNADSISNHASVFIVRKNIIIIHRYLNGTNKMTLIKHDRCVYIIVVLILWIARFHKIAIYIKMACLCDTFKFIILLFIELFHELLLSLYLILHGIIAKIVSLFVYFSNYYIFFISKQYQLLLWSDCQTYFCWFSMFSIIT